MLVLACEIGSKEAKEEEQHIPSMVRSVTSSRHLDRSVGENYQSKADCHLAGYWIYWHWSGLDSICFSMLVIDPARYHRLNCFSRPNTMYISHAFRGQNFL